MNLQVGPNSRSQRFFNKKYGSCSSIFCSISNSLSFNFSNTARNANHHSGEISWPKHFLARKGGFLNEVPQHLLSYFKVRNDSIYQGFGGCDIGGSPAYHFPCIVSNS